MSADPYKYFRVEAREIVEQLGQGVLDIEKGMSRPELIARLLRLAHTLKGAARVVKQAEIAEQAHAIEDSLEPYRGSAVLVPRETVEVLLQLVDGIGRRIAALTRTRGPEEASTSSVQPDDVVPAAGFDSAAIDELLDGIAEAHAQLGLLSKAAASDERARYLVDVVDRELRQTRAAAERMRLIPVNRLFTALERSARDVAQAQGKQVLFEGRGGDIRLDVQMLGPIQSALLQLVRNAVAHGIEPPKERLTAAKPKEGRIHVDVATLGSKVVFRCRDDGRGIDVEAIRRAVERKGLPAAETVNMSPQELMQVLLKGGISTSRTVTEVSGRGVGLDVVRETVERLGGEVSLQTEAGRGVTVEVVVPLFVSSVEALLVEASGSVAAIPLNAVRTNMRVGSNELTDTPSGQTIVFGGKTVPFCPLTRILSSGSFVNKAARSWSAVIVEGKGGLAAIGVDRLNGTATVVLRPLPELATVSPVVAGLSQNADGNLQLVLDPDGLVEEIRRAPLPRLQDERRRLPLLVIDDSLTTRMLEQSILESAGYEVDVAISGEEGLEKARHKRYGLFLVDIEMPGIDGFTFIDKTHADPMLKDIPCILVTSRESSMDRKRGEQIGAQGYVVKSEFNQDALLERIRELVG